MTGPRTCLLLLSAWLMFITACGTATSSTAPQDVTVSPQNSVFLIGAGRISVALTAGRTPILGATASVDIPNGSGFDTRSLEFVGHDYAQIPVYIGVANFAHEGDTVITVHLTETDGSKHQGIAHITVTSQSPELPVGFKVPSVTQPIASTVNGNLALIDTGVPGPDPWHTETVAQGLAAHQPMVILFATPGRCTSATCGPTLKIVEELGTALNGQMLFEHIEPDYPAQSNTINPAVLAFGLRSEPWVYFVNSSGVVSDRFEGPVVLDQLLAAAKGTLAGKVPAVALS